MANTDQAQETQEKKEQEKPTTILLIRHGENDWTETNKLAGRTPGVHLNEYGRQQAQALGERLAKAEIDLLYTSPLERTVETAQAIAAHHQGLEVVVRQGVLEVDYGDWRGQPLKELAEDERWPVIQRYPSGASFPNGETMFNMQARMIAEINAIVAQHPGQTVVVVAHADLIKAMVAHCLGVHFDLFQRITISTASISTISFFKLGPRVITVNDVSHNPPRPKKDEDDKTQA